MKIYLPIVDIRALIGLDDYSEANTCLEVTFSSQIHWIVKLMMTLFDAALGKGKAKAIVKLVH
jgi:hypothetical protein